MVWAPLGGAFTRRSLARHMRAGVDVAIYDWTEPSAAVAGPADAAAVYLVTAEWAGRRTSQAVQHSRAHFVALDADVSALVGGARVLAARRPAPVSEFTSAPPAYDVAAFGDAAELYAAMLAWRAAPRAGRILLVASDPASTASTRARADLLSLSDAADVVLAATRADRTRHAAAARIVLDFDARSSRGMTDPLAAAGAVGAHALRFSGPLDAAAKDAAAALRKIGDAPRDAAAAAAYRSARAPAALAKALLRAVARVRRASAAEASAR